MAEVFTYSLSRSRFIWLVVTYLFQLWIEITLLYLALPCPSLTVSLEKEKDGVLVFRIYSTSTLGWENLALDM